MFHQRMGIKTGMGRIASAASAHPDLFEYRFSPFINGNPASRIGLRAGDGGEKTRCAPADDGYIHGFTTRIRPLDSC